MKIKLSTYIIITAALAWLSGCGGAGSDGYSPGGGGGNAGGGIGGTGVISSGLISATGSITVNGIKYETENAQIFMDGEELLDDSRLKVGMFVEVDGEINDDGTTGTASIVRFDDNVEGPVTSIDLDTRVIEILGQTVLVDPQTVFDNSSVFPANITGLTVGDVVEVSGQIDDQGNIRATHIEKTASTNLEITGFVSGLINDTFTINGLVVDFSNAILEDFSVGVPQNGDFVEVKGSAYDAPTSTLTATRVENKARNIVDNVKVEVESFVISVTSNGFSVFTSFGKMDVVYDGFTEFRGGAAIDIIVGAKVEAEGSIQGNVLLADKVSIKENIRIEVAAAGADGTTLTLQLRSLSAISVSIDSRTELDDKRDTPTSTANMGTFLDSINQDDHLKLKGRFIGNGQVIAVELEVDDPESNLDDVVLRGPVDDAPTGTTLFTILGIEINTANASRFEDRMGNLIDRSTFFGAIETGTSVKASGELSADNSIDSEELDLED